MEPTEQVIADFLHAPAPLPPVEPTYSQENVILWLSDDMTAIREVEPPDLAPFFTIEDGFLVERLATRLSTFAVRQVHIRPFSKKDQLVKDRDAR